MSTPKTVYQRAREIWPDGNIRFTQATAEDYQNALEVLPPAARGRYGFLMGEVSHHNSKGQGVYYAFFHWSNGRYSCGMMTLEQFDNLNAGYGRADEARREYEATKGGE